MSVKIKVKPEWVKVKCQDYLTYWYNENHKLEELAIDYEMSRWFFKPKTRQEALRKVMFRSSYYMLKPSIRLKEKAEALLDVCVLNAVTEIELDLETLTWLGKNYGN